MIEFNRFVTTVKASLIAAMLTSFFKTYSENWKYYLVILLIIMIINQHFNNLKSKS